MDIAIIPARGGSKRIPRKNVKSFCGKPMIYYSIKAALEFYDFDQVIISTDDDEIRDIGISLGAKVPFKRPQNLADDLTPTVPVIRHAILECEKLGWNINLVCCIYATAPFLDIRDLRRAKTLTCRSHNVYSFPVCEYSSPIQRALGLNSDGTVNPLFPDNELCRTQDLKKTCFDVGQFYFARKNTWLTQDNIHQNGQGVMIPKWRAIDIDDEDDWTMAEKMFYSQYISSN